MGISEHLINVLSAIVAVEYMDYGFQKKYRGVKRFGFFCLGCIAYFSVVTVFNHLFEFEGVLGFFYGTTLIAYGLLALEGNWQDFVIMGVLWVFIAMISTYCIFGVTGIVSEKSLDMLLPLADDKLLYASLVALIVKFSMGKVGVALFRKKVGVHKRENLIVAGAFVLMTLLAMGLFCLEIGDLEYSRKYWMTIGILIDEALIVVFLVEIYHRLGKYQQEEMERQYQKRMEAERQEGLMDLYRVGREINHWRHDMLGELGVLYHMMRNGKHREVEHHLGALYDNLKQYPELPQPTGNEGLDAALMKMIPKCKEKGIHFSYVIFGRPTCIDSISMGNLMDNLLSNALEACMEVSDDKMIELRIWGRGDMLEIDLENTIRESVMGNNPQLFSHKDKIERHGFGISSIYSVVRSYGGEYNYWEEDGRFCQNIRMKFETNGLKAANTISKI